eukprot:100529-Hanusia_phi.AAC.2
MREEYLRSLEEVSLEKGKIDVQTDIKGRFSEMMATMHSLPVGLQSNDSTIVMNNCSWDFEECRFLTSKIGGLDFENYEGYTGIYIRDQSNAALLNCVMESFSNSAIRATDNACICLEYCRVNKALFENSHASEVFFGFLSVPHGGLDGPQVHDVRLLNRSRVFANSAIDGNLWRGYGRATNFEMENTTFTGLDDYEEEHRIRYAKVLEKKRTYLQGKGLPIDDVIDPEELDRAKFAEIQLENFKEFAGASVFSH